MCRESGFCGFGFNKISQADIDFVGNKYGEHVKALDNNKKMTQIFMKVKQNEKLWKIKKLLQIQGSYLEL